VAAAVKVIMPVAIKYPEAQVALLRSRGRNTIDFEHVGHNQYAYWNLFVTLWREGEPFVLVEHDIVVRPSTIQQLEDCPRPWCGFVYHEAPGEPVAGLGCTKFTPGFDLPVLEPLVWQNVDSAVGGIMRTHGLVRHDHQPWLRHLNPTVAGYQT
jgi:hypothetical protein